MQLFDSSLLEKYDSQDMHKVYDKWPQIAKEAYQTNLDGIELKGIDHIVISGMGGSGIIGDILSAILSRTKIHVCVVKGYHLPSTVTPNTLVVTISISGNTTETLTVLDSAKKMRCKLISFSGGGKMEDYCKKNKIEYRKIPLLHSPRASLIRYLYSILKILDSVVPIRKEEVIESISMLEKTQKKISSSNTHKNPSIELAQWITGIPMIYYPAGLQSVAIRFKSSIQENAKLHAMMEDVIEASHNNIVAWEKKSNAQPILIRGEDDYFKTKERWEILKEYFKKNMIEYNQVFSVEGNILSKLVNLIYLLDYTTIYLAVISKTDPSPIRSIDFLKRRISSE